jgi:uncharacterized membrane protein YphA (DoxX/SURF4 family)
MRAQNDDVCYSMNHSSAPSSSRAAYGWHLEADARRTRLDPPSDAAGQFSQHFLPCPHIAWARAKSVLTEVPPMEAVRKEAFAPGPELPVEAPLRSSPSYQAYWLLHVAFVIAPIVAGADKFLDVLVNWDQYLAPIVVSYSPLPAHELMLVVGVIEIIAGILVAIKPRYFAYIVTLWLWGIIANLLLIPGYFDVALRDFGLSLGSLALARLAAIYDR